MGAARQSQQGPAAIGSKCLIVGAAYSIASSAIAALLGPVSRLQPTWGNAVIWLLVGTLSCASLAPFILRSTWSRLNTLLAVWGVMVFVRSLGLGIEGSLFKPAEATATVAGTLSGTFVSFLVAWFSVALLLPERTTSPAQAAGQSNWWGWTWRVLLVGLAYFLFYFVFGATNALLYTRSFYENNPKYGLSLPPPATIFLAQLVRGPLFGLGSLFIVRAANMPRRQTGVWLGLLLFVVGGLGPYLETTFCSMPLGFNLATLAELFLQNFLTGLVAARLLVPGPTPRGDQMIE